MKIRSAIRPDVFYAVAVFLLLGSCTPTLDWREVRGANPPYVVLLPAKPSTVTRTINLDGTQISMTMTTAEADGIIYAVGSAILPNAANAQAALAAMKTALVKNINGVIVRETSAAAQSSAGQSRTIDIEARGQPNNASNSNGAGPRLLFARFVSREQRVYQVVAAGSEKRISREAVDTFLTSFKPN